MKALKIRIFEDTYMESFFRIMCASLPFLTVGMLWNNVILYVSVAIGVLALAASIARMTVCFKRRAVEKEPSAFSKDVNDLLALPYAMALSTAIAVGAGFDVSFTYWLALFLGAVMVLPNHLKAVR